MHDVASGPVGRPTTFGELEAPRQTIWRSISGLHEIFTLISRHSFRVLIAKVTAGLFLRGRRYVTTQQSIQRVSGYFTLRHKCQPHEKKARGSDKSLVFFYVRLGRTKGTVRDVSLRETFHL